MIQKFQIWADLVPRFKYPIFMRYDIQSRENTLVLNMLFVIDDLISNFGPAIEELSDFMKFRTKNKWSILINIHCRGTGQISF